MIRGVHVPDDPYVKKRMIRGYYIEQEREFYKTVLLVKAARDPESNLSDIFEMYRQAIWPSQKTNEEIVEEARAVLSEFEKQTIEVSPIITSDT